MSDIQTEDRATMALEKIALSLDHIAVSFCCVEEKLTILISQLQEIVHAIDHK